MEDVSVIKKAAEMNAEHVLAHFDRIADAPDAIPRLRRFILDLAVRSKLVPQDQNDEPASELLKRIAAEKARLVREKKISKQIPFLPFDLSEVPFDLPDSWAWCPSTYPSYIVSDKGKKVQTKDVFETGEFPVVDQGKVLIRGYHNDANKVICIKAPLVLFGDHTREMKLIDFDFVVGADGVKLLQPVSLHTPYYFLALQWLPLESRGYGRHFKLLKASFIPLPPLAEQHRIVAKVDELMALCDRLEAARVEREATRDRMATASLARLNAPDPDPATFQNHAAFALNNLTPLTTRPDQIKALRQTILDLAVRGKLVPQDPNDEPASEMLRKIAETRKFLIVERKMKRPKDLLPVENREIHFSIPAGWAITRMGVAYDVRDGTHDSPKYVDKGYPLITSKNLSSGYLSFDDTKLISKEDYIKISQRSAVVKGDILLAMIGSIGNPVIVDTDQPFAIKNVALLKYFDPDYSNPKFLRFFLLNAANEMKALAVGGLQPFVSLNFLRNYPLAIPPLAEQHRIVTKVDKLMAFCDQLEVSLTTSDETRGLLVEALLHETLVQGTPGQARRQVGRPAIYTTQDA